jgi:hypothetical protein
MKIGVESERWPPGRGAPLDDGAGARGEVEGGRRARPAGAHCTGSAQIVIASCKKAHRHVCARDITSSRTLKPLSADIHINVRTNSYDRVYL